ncbi:hypothetical protein FSARC_4284 [Fusarium sarcochroum]|uniref:Zn(2)-C6 fungal-type domain-containing protein n=1 Tax=Fusarium sarcochroum TaxID=1208366 RepID=A0A8H4U219_9HYPO|nr:hypothetical protein FSARC_4284 [Fusarium sarcochroum]
MDLKSIKPSPSQATPKPDPAAEEPTTCRECRRRKVKCDGVMPVCSICKKYRRHCLQLTLLEERLEKAEVVLRRHYTDSQIAEMLEGPKEALKVDSKAPETASAPTPAPAPTPASGPANLPTTAGSNTDNLMQLPTPNTGLYMPSPSSVGTFTTDPLLLAPIGELQAIAGPWAGLQDTSFEIAPTPADNCEWNEQEVSWGTYDPTTWQITNDGNASQAIMDGMASLSIGDQKKGYFGAASGAALLRQILSARPDGEEVDAEVALHQIESLFQQHSDHSQWFRSQAMLTRVAVENLIDAFFVFYHPTFPIVHEPTFRAQYAGTLACANKGHWNTLANIIAALGSFASSNVADATDLPIFQAAQKSLFSNYLEVGNLTLIQAFGLASTYMQKRNKPNTGFNYAGLAIRLAIGLGLHKDLEGNSLSPLQTETRRRIWWCLCVLDVGATITYGRPLNWPQAGVETMFPVNIHEKSLTHDSDSYPPEVDGITTYTYLRVQSAYHLNTMTIYNRLITSPFPSATDLITLDDVCIGSWLAQVPYYYHAFPPSDSEFALGIGISEWRYRNLRIVMYRPFLVRWAQPSSQNTQHTLTSSENLAVFRCLDAAKESITSIQAYWTSRSHSRLAAFYILYFLFHATLIPVHCLRQNPHHSLAADWRSQIQASLIVMGAMAELNPNSSKCRDITLKLCWPHLDEDGSHTFCDSATFMPGTTDSEAASIISGYNTWTCSQETLDFEASAHARLQHHVVRVHLDVHNFQLVSAMDESSIASLVILCTSISTRAEDSAAEAVKLAGDLGRDAQHVLQLNFVSTALDQLKSHAARLEGALHAGAVVSQQMRDALARSLEACESTMATSHKQLMGLQPGVLKTSDTSFLMAYGGFVMTHGQLFDFVIKVLAFTETSQQEKRLDSPVGKQTFEQAETATRLVASSRDVQFDEDTTSGSGSTQLFHEQDPATNTVDAPPSYSTSTTVSPGPINPIDGPERSKGSSFFRSLTSAFRHKPDPFVSALCQAVMHGHERQVSDLISQGAKINGRNEDGNTPFKCAIISDQAGTARILLSAGAKSSTSASILELPPLFQAVSMGSLNVARVLIEFGASVNSKAVSGTPHFVQIVTEGNVAAAEFLISNGAEANTRTQGGQFVITIAARQDNVEMARLLLDHGADVNATDITGCPILSTAFEKRSTSMIGLLLERGANANARSQWGGTILFHAISNKELDIARQLLNGGADPGSKDGHSQPILVQLIRHGLLRTDNTVEAVRLLLDNGADPDTTDIAYGLPIICHAVEMPNAGVVEEILRHGAKTKVRMLAGQTLLTYSIDVNRRDHINVLLGYGVDINEVDGLNRTPLSLALLRIDYNLTKMLVEHGADPTAKTNEQAVKFIKALRRNDLLELLGLTEGARNGNSPRVPGPSAEASGSSAVPPPSYEIAAGKF